MVARFDRKFMALNQSVTHAAGKAGRVVPCAPRRSAGSSEPLRHCVLKCILRRLEKENFEIIDRKIYGFDRKFVASIENLWL